MKYKRLRSSGYAARRCLGLSRFEARLESGGAYLRVGDSDKDSAETIATVKAVQAALRLPPTGKIDGRTAQAIESTIGSGWENRTYLAILQEIRKQQGGTFSRQRAPGLARLLGLGSIDQYGLGAGEMGAADAGFRMEGSTAVPTSEAARESFVRLQAQVNRFSSSMGFTPLALDGRIGQVAGTTVHKVARNVHLHSSGDDDHERLLAEARSAGPNTAWIASRAQDLAAVFAYAADLSQRPQAPPVKKRNGAGPTTDVAALSRQQATSSKIGELLPYAALAVGAYLLLTGKKGRKRA